MILSLWMDQEIHPSWRINIDSVKIYPSLLMTREHVWCQLAKCESFMQNFSWILHELVGNLLWSAGQISVSNQACGNGHQPEGIEFHRRERNWLWLLKTEEVFWISCNFQFVEWLSIVAKLEREILNVEHWQAVTCCLLTVSRSWIPWGGDWDEDQIWEVGHNHQNTNIRTNTNTKIPKPMQTPKY